MGHLRGRFGEGRAGSSHRLRGGAIKPQADNGMTVIHKPSQTGDHPASQAAATSIHNTNRHQMLSPLPVVVMVSLPCFTPFTLSNASATLRMAAPLPLATSTSRQ